MRKFVAIALFAAAAMVFTSASASAADDAKPEAAHAKAAEKDPNYRYHNGQWWYWIGKNKSWKVWDGNQWNDYQPGQARSFSYQQPEADSAAQDSTYQMFGRPLTSTPYSVGTNSQIIGSYGFRRAGSKAMGNY